MRLGVCMGALVACVAGCAASPPEGGARRVVGDAMPVALTTEPGDPARGREVLVGRDGNCLLCHGVPETGARFMGNLAPPLSGVGARLDAGQLRLRLVDSARVNTDTIMPAYFRTDGLRDVAAAYRDRTILSAQQIEDAVAYLLTLR